MIGYRDKAWCSQKNCKNKCGRKITDDVMLSATKWWGSPNPPFCLMEFCDENGELKK